MSIKILSIHKEESISYSKTQDKYAYGKKLEKFCVSDGATQGFFSGKKKRPRPGCV